MKNIRALLLVVSSIMSWIAPCIAFSQTTLPTVKVTAERIGGGMLMCTTVTCAGALDEEQYRERMAYMRMYATYPQDDLPIDKAKFCSNLKGKKPSNCDFFSPPMTPEYSSNWMPDGCGSGPRQQWFLDRLVSSASSGQYSGNLNAPYSGISFQAACNEHDRCWGVGKEKSSCDMAFSNNMQNACSSASNPNGLNICLGFAGLYYGAVATTNAAQVTYQDSVMAYACAGWAYDMRLNGCSP
ncbi:hypothetical protein [[Pseudomonas] boreopolis]|uniref:hypothetical protein n=1 Tax=Xanthomonas boreopolis TaxID=86183 RepID=UPI003DA0A9A4